MLPIDDAAWTAEYGRSDGPKLTSKRTRSKTKILVEECSAGYQYKMQLIDMNSMVVKSSDTMHKLGALCEGIFKVFVRNSGDSTKIVGRLVDLMSLQSADQVLSKLSLINPDLSKYIELAGAQYVGTI